MDSQAYDQLIRAKRQDLSFAQSEVERIQAELDQLMRDRDKELRRQEKGPALQGLQMIAEQEDIFPLEVSRFKAWDSSYYRVAAPNNSISISISLRPNLKRPQHVYYNSNYTREPETDAEGNVTWFVAIDGSTKTNSQFMRGTARVSIPEKATPEETYDILQANVRTNILKKVQRG